MFKYGLTKKQCGVIFLNWKKGNLEVSDEFIKWMYNHIADRRVYCDDSHMADIFSKMNNGLQLVFKGEYAEASECLNSAYEYYQTIYKVA